jgi:primosomal protein N' (replication factor Y)
MDDTVPPNDNLKIVSVGLPSALPFPRPLSYSVPEGMALAPGDWVEVPLGKRTLLGVVWDAEDEDTLSDSARAKLKPVTVQVPGPRMREPLRRLIDWLAAYTLSSHGAVLRMAVHLPAINQQDAPRIAYLRADIGTGVNPPDVRVTAARQRVLDVALTPMSGRDLAEAAGTSTAVLRAMADAGLLRRVTLEPAKPPAPNPDLPGPDLSPEQHEAAVSLSTAVTAHQFQVSLIDGVTGSGKTEVYFEAIATALRAGGQVLVLLPEIALTAQWLDRFRARFGIKPSVWHSEVGASTRRRSWRWVADGSAKIVVGARSALFLPFNDLRLIVVDEEHDQAFKQEDGVRYHARDIAIVRAQMEAIPICLVSATPSLETVANVERGRYHKLVLPTRHGGAALPSLELVNLIQEPPPRGQWIAPPVVDAVTEALSKGEQALLFLNRRGYAPLTLCRTCGHRFACKLCDAWLVEHRYTNRLQCHHCGHTERIPPACPTCNATESLAACGPGVERIAEEVAERWPDARVAVMSSDLLQGPQAVTELIDSIGRHEIDLIVGTQLIAKGHHFPLLTVVGVVDADLGLAGGDLRAAERTFQLLTQVAGRAGRAERPGRVLLQTTEPEQPVLQALAAGDRDAFYRAEAAARQDAGMPPYGRLAALVVSANDLSAAMDFAQKLAAKAPHSPTVRVLGPAPAPLSLVRGRHRVRLLLHASRETNVPRIMREWIDGMRPAGSVRLAVDIDPYSFL